MSRLLDLNLASIIISDLNEEIKYKLGDHTEGRFTEDLLSLESDGEDHHIMFLNRSLWSSKVERQLEDIPIEVELTLNERKKFEKHIRMLINDRINILKHLDL